MKWKEMKYPCVCYLGFSKIEKKEGNSQGNWEIIDRMTFLVLPFWWLILVILYIYLEVMIYHLFFLVVSCMYHLFWFMIMMFVDIVGWLYNGKLSARIVIVWSILSNWGVQKNALKDLIKGCLNCFKKF